MEPSRLGRVFLEPTRGAYSATGKRRRTIFTNWSVVHLPFRPSREVNSIPFIGRPTNRLKSKIRMTINKIWSSTRTSISGVSGESLARVFTSTDERSRDGCGRAFPNVHVHFKCTYTSPCYEGVQFEIELRGENTAKPFLPYVPKSALRAVNVPVRGCSARHRGLADHKRRQECNLG